MSRLLLIFCAVACAAQVRPLFVRHPGAPLTGERIAGAVLDGPELVTWGDRLLAWALPPGRPRPIIGAGSHSFGPAGCLLDLDGDGFDDFIVQDGDALVWFQAPDWTRREIAADVDTPELLPAVLHGRRGVLLVQKYMQVRFYEAPSDPAGPWPVHDLYSIYTPSRQAGLLVRDVDCDGFRDLLVGNYWVRSPDLFGLPWRLFAINTWWEESWSATLRLALANLTGTSAPELIAAQAEAVAGARLAWFERSADLTSLWIEHRLEGSLDLRRPRGLAAADLDGDGLTDIAVAEDNGADSRLFIFWNEGAGRFTAELVSRGDAVHSLFVTDVNGDGRPDLAGAGPNSVTWWENAGTHHRPAASPRARAKTGP